MPKRATQWLGRVMILFVSGCATPPAADCSWIKEILVQSDDRITIPTARALVAHNRKVREFCPQTR